MKAVCVILVIVSLIACKESHPRDQASKNISRATKSKESINYGDPSKTARVSKRWGREVSEYSNLDIESLEKAISSISDLRYSADKREEFELLIGELASRSPKAALSFFQPTKMRPSEPGFAFVSSLLAEIDPSALKNWLKTDLKVGTVGVRAECLRVALLGLATTDPEDALQFFSKGNWDEAGRSDALNAIFSTWARESPTEAEVAAKSVLTGKNLDDALKGIAIIAKTSDPNTALNIASQIKSDSSRWDTINSVFSSWIDADKESSIKQLHSFHEAEIQKILIADLDLDSDRSFLNKLIRHDPATIVNFLAKIVPSSGNEVLFTSAISALSSAAPDQATALLDIIPPGQLKISLISTQFAVLARNDLNESLKLAGQFPDESSRMQALKSIASSIDGPSCEFLIASASDFPMSERKILIGTAIANLSSSEPQKAADLLTENQIIFQGDRKDNLITTVARNLARADLKAADEWMKMVPISRQPSVMKGIAEEMASRDVLQLSERLANMPISESWEEGVKVLIKSIKSSDPEMARSWSNALKLHAGK